MQFQDWEFIQSYLISNKVLKCLGRFTDVPLVGRFFTHYLFGHLSLSYDITVNFVEAHEHTARTIASITQSNECLELVLREAQAQVELAEQFMASVIEQPFPEISQAIQHRRAERFLLVNESSDIDRMLKQGEIEEKDAGVLKREIDERIQHLIMNAPEIHLTGPGHKSNLQRMVQYSVLAEVFDQDELQKAVDQMGQFDEHMYQPRQRLQHKEAWRGKILYVARGTLVEQVGAGDLHYAGQIRHQKGSITCLHNLLPDGEKLVGQLGTTDIRCHHSGIASVAILDVRSLQEALQEDDEKMKRLWVILAPRIITLSPDALPEFKSLTHEKVALFCRMCMLRVYKDGEEVDM